MKKNIAIAILASLAFALSCTSDFLTVENPKAKPIEEYFTTEQSVYESLVAAYAPLAWPDWFGDKYTPVNIASDLMADQLWPGGGTATDFADMKALARFDADARYTLPGLWSAAYSGVKRSNDVLQYIGWTKQAGNISDDTAKRYEAEARALRVFYYNWLWKFWGNIPYFETNLEEPFVCEQITADEVYNKIITDLEGVIEMDVLPMIRPQADAGRVTLAMVYMLYAEITMYQNDETRLPTALNYMKEIIADSNYDLLPDYADVFKESGEWGSETIFDVNYVSEGGRRDWSWVTGEGGTILPRLIGPRGWPDGTGGYMSGWGLGAVRLSTVEMFDPADARKDVTCFNVAGLAEELGVQYESTAYQHTGYYLQKYAPLDANRQGCLADWQMNFNNNLRVYRYAETLLNAAELVVRGYGSGDAAGWLNLVHGRSLGGATVELSLENIKKERSLEFVGEGKRYWDLVRWELTSDPDGIQASKVLTGPDELEFRKISWTPSKKYIPIPDTEISAAAGSAYPLTQNNY